MKSSFCTVLAVCFALALFSGMRASPVAAARGWQDSATQTVTPAKPSVVDAQGNWLRYVQKNKRRDIVKNARQESGIGAGLATNSISAAIWISEPVAAAIVSAQMDRERLTPEEAEESFRALRPADAYVIGLVIRLLEDPDFDIGDTDEKDSKKILKRREVFLQRKADTSRFSRGEIHDTDLDLMMAEGFSPNRFLFFFPKVDREGRPLVSALGDVMQFQFKLVKKEIVLNFEPRKFADALKDL